MSDEVLASGVLGLYHHVNGEWKPVKNDANAKSSATLTRAKNGSYSLKVTYTLNNESLLLTSLSKSCSFQLQAGYETFYLLYDGKVYWGFWFSDSTVATIFAEKMNDSLKAIASDGALGSKSVPTSVGGASGSKSSKSSAESSTPTRSGSAPGTKKHPSSSATPSPSKLPSTISEAVLSKPTSSPVKINSTISEAVLSKPNVVKNSKGLSTPPSSAVPPLSANGNLSAPNSAGGLKRPLANSSSSVPNSPGSVDDSTLSSPTSRTLKRPDSARKRAGTTLSASDDKHSKSSATSEAEKEKKPKQQREKIIDEVLKTEEDYVDSLTLIREKYLLPLKYAPRLGVSIFKPGDLEKIMYGIEPIFVLNTALLGVLRLRKHDGTLYDLCGATIARYAPSMKLYIDYVNKYENTIKTIKEYEDSNPLFKQFLTMTSEDPESANRSILDFWIMPVQRIPRYALLMTELLKHTPETHADYPHIKQALEQFQSIANYINTRKKEYDSQEKVALVQQRLNPKSIPIMRERRIWIAEGTLYMRNSLFIPPKKPIVVKKGKPEPLPEALGLSEIEFFLMNDLIMWAIKDPKHAYLNDLGRIPIHELITCDERPSWSVPFYDNTAMYKAFTLRTQDHNEDTAPIFYCPDPASCDKWIAVIKETFQKTAKDRALELERLANASLSPVNR